MSDHSKQEKRVGREAFSFRKRKPLRKEKYRNNIIYKGMRVKGENRRFFSLKGQQQALSVILITGILVGVSVSVYLWGLPLIQKNRDISIQQNSESFMKNLAERFKFIANHGGRERLALTTTGNVVFDPVTKTIEFTIETQGTTYETETWIQLGKNPCTMDIGKWGVDETETLCVKSIKSGDTYVTVYRLSFVQLNTQTLTSYKIDLSGIESSGGEGHAIIVENTGTRTVVQNGINVVTTTLDVNIES